MIVPGVLPGSKGPLFYPPAEVGKNVDWWNGVPIVSPIHPVGPDGRPIAANRGKSTKYAWNKFGVGRVRNAHISQRGNLAGVGRFDVQRMRRIAPDLLEMIENGEPVELSTGLFTQDVPVPPGTKDSKGRPYDFIATNYKPDHLAVLAFTPGACSLKDGCGVGVYNANNNPEGCNQYKKCGGGTKALQETGAFAKLKGVAKKVATRVLLKVKERYTGLKNRYGKTGAKAVLVGVLAPIPGSAPIAIGLAEGIRGLGKIFRRKKITRNVAVAIALNLSIEDMVDDAMALIREFYSDADEDTPKIDESDVRSAIEDSLQSVEPAEVVTT